MSERPTEDLYRSWRAAEGRGEDAAADAALAALVRALPPEAPSPGFARATLARMAVRRAEAAVPTWVKAPAVAADQVTARATRRAAAVLATLSAGTLAAASLAVTVLPRLDLAGGVRAFNAVVAALWGWIAAGVALWLRAAEWSAVLARLIAVPEVAWSLLGAALVASLAFYLLRRILAHERTPIHETYT
ncbi:MAG TPA: hypothetical protein VLF66_18290 [Thermoanaerobaculia bacterium]|nr:hypothetical protein [Thermoanaerobaculia bacterium]